VSRKNYGKIIIIAYVYATRYHTYTLNGHLPSLLELASNLSISKSLQGNLQTFLGPTGVLSVMNYVKQFVKQFESYSIRPEKFMQILNRLIVTQILIFLNE